MTRRTPIALAALLACRGPMIAGGDEAESKFGEDSHGEAESESETGDEPDPLACVAWNDPVVPTGMGPSVPLGFVDATLELGLIDTAYFPGEWPPSCDPNGEGWVGSPCKMYLQGGGAAVGDFDDDGWPDIYLSRLAGPGLLFRNLEGVAFESVGAQLGLLDSFDGNGAAWVDIDGDGDLDLYVTSFGDPARFWLYRNTLRETGEAGFVEEAIARGLALADGEPHFGFSIAVGDYDRDGWLDLYTTEWRPGLAATEASSHARLLRNLGDGSFEDRTLEAGVSMLMKNPAGLHAFAPAFVDLDEDGWLDLAVVSDNGTSRLFWNQGGSFLDGTPRAGVSLERNGMGSSFGDYDGDGHLDWYVTAIFSPESSPECGNLVCGKGGNRLYRSKGPRCFEELALAHGVHDGGWGWGAALFDPDNDGDLDIVATNGFYVPHGPPGSFFVHEPLRFWRNHSEQLGASEYSEVAAEVGLVDLGQGRGLVVFDFDRDGDEDLLIVDSGGPFGGQTKLWRNETGTQNAWLDVELDARPGNTRGIGARVELQRTPGGPIQVRVIGVGTHFLGHGENRAHFGLGPSETVVAELRVIWPSGAHTVLTGVPARQVLTLVEPFP
jgi:enediyne biosynthesis protein E4